MLKKEASSLWFPKEEENERKDNNLILSIYSILILEPMLKIRWDRCVSLIAEKWEEKK